MRAVKKFGFILMLVALAGQAIAQQVKVTKESARVKGENAEGFETELEGSVDDVNTALTKYLKTFGRLKFGATPITFTEIIVNGTSYKSPVYALVKAKDNTAAAWIGLRENEWTNAEEAEKVKKELERIVYDFGVKYYRDQVQVQIDEAMRALQAVERQQQRLTTENKNLNLRLENNQKEKIQLEQSIEANKLEYLNLLIKIEQNKKGQDSIAVALEQVRKVVEMHREKQKKIN